MNLHIFPLPGPQEVGSAAVPAPPWKVRHSLRPGMDRNHPIFRDQMRYRLVISSHRNGRSTHLQQWYTNLLGDLSTAPRFSRQTRLTLLEVYQTLEAQNAIWRLPEAFLGFWGSSSRSRPTIHGCSVRSHTGYVLRFQLLPLCPWLVPAAWFCGLPATAVVQIPIPASSSLAAWFGNVLLRLSQFDFLGKNQTHMGASGKIWDPHQVTMVGEKY